jgi:hypothetical protein
MGIPGFTAETSLYQTNWHYRVAAVSTSNAGIHVVPAQRGFVTPFAGGGNGGNGGGGPPIIECFPNDSVDPPSDCPSGFALCSLDPATGDCTNLGKCCNVGPPPPPPTPAQCLSAANSCLTGSCFIPFPGNCGQNTNCLNQLTSCLNQAGVQTS